MSEVWGLLEKSLTDDETINEAINAAIASHEADASAHLGVGESLESHKTSEVIDHLAGSVVADKIGATEYVAKTVFDSLDHWVVTGNCANDSWPGVVLVVDYSATNPSELKSGDPTIPDFITWTKNILFQVSACVVETISKTLIFGFGDRSGSNMTDGFGFKIVNGTLYGYLEADGTFRTTTLNGVNIYVPHSYRAYWNAVDKTVYFFIDGVQVGTISVVSTSGQGDGFIHFYVKADASGEVWLYVYELFISRAF